MKVKTFNIIKWFLLPWIILQTLVGLDCFVYSKIRGYCKRIKTDEGIVYYEVDNSNPCYGVSLGLFVFLQQKYFGDKLAYRHEWGHQIQSLILGPLYLLVIGLPSAITNLFKTYDTNIKYFNYPWEHWADFCGGIRHKDLRYSREIST